MKKIIAYICFLFTLPAYGQTLQDIDYKVALIKKCITEITYPSIITKSDEFLIGIASDYSTFQAFSSSLGTLKLKNNTKVSVKHIKDYSEIGGNNIYPIMYLTETSSMLYAGVKGAIGNKPTLFVTEKEGMAERGSDINFVKKNDRWRYEINKALFTTKKLRSSADFDEKAINKKTLTSKEIEEPIIKERERIVLKNDPATLARVRDLEAETERLRSGKTTIEKSYKDKEQEYKLSTLSLDKLKSELDTTRDIVKVRERALLEAGKAQKESKRAAEERISRINTENESKEKQKEAKRQQEIANTRIFMIGLVGILGVISTIAVLTFIANRRRQKIINQLEVARNELSESNIQLDTQKNELAEQNLKIKDSLRYALTIQQAMLPSEQELNHIFASHFVMYEPKDIVSGDFYWVAKRPDAIFLAVADCTGHGVPGAFLSTVGNDILNELINEKHLHEPNEILSALHSGIYDRLRQGETNNKDGMDIGLCRVMLKENDTCEVTFAGAKRPIYYTEDGNIKTLKGDSKYIGGIQEEAPVFQNYPITLKKGEKIYMTTDGYVDTPNKEKRKFGSTKFQELMQEIQAKPLQEQHKIFIERWETHRNDAELRDDTTILAVEI